MYLIKTNTQWSIQQSEFCMKCYKTKHSRMIFHLLKYYRNQNLQL